MLPLTLNAQQQVSEVRQPFLRASELHKLASFYTISQELCYVLSMIVLLYMLYYQLECKAYEQ